MRLILILLTLLYMFPFQSFSQENIRGIFFENPSPHLLGIRLVNRKSRTEDHYIFDPHSRVHVDTKLESFTLSAQLITSSFPIDCCEWKEIGSGDTLTIEYFEDKTRCSCKISR